MGPNTALVPMFPLRSDCVARAQTVTPLRFPEDFDQLPVEAFTGATTVALVLGTLHGNELTAHRTTLTVDASPGPLSAVPLMVTE
jgi:hypothetical protein